MSAIRVPGPDGVRLVDPYTRREYVPDFTGSEPSGPVTVRKATPEELARLAGPDVKPRTEVSMYPRAPKTLVTDTRAAALRGAAATARKAPRPIPGTSDPVVLDALRTAGGNVTEAARILGASQSSLHRRVAWMRKHRVVPSDVEAMLAGPRPRWSRRKDGAA